MAAHEHEAQDVVVDEVAGVGATVGDVGRRLGVDDEQRLLAQRDRLGAQAVDDPAPGHRREPGAGRGRDAVAAPRASRRLHGIREGVLDEVQATELREEQGDEAAPLLAHRGREDLVRCHVGSYPSISTTGRISTV